MTALVEYGTRGVVTRNVNPRDRDVAIAEATQHTGLEVVTRVNGGEWQPADEIAEVARG